MSRRRLFDFVLLLASFGASVELYAQIPSGASPNQSLANPLLFSQSQQGQVSPVQRTDPFSYCIDEFGNTADCLSNSRNNYYGIDGDSNNSRMLPTPSAGMYGPSAGMYAPSTTIPAISDQRASQMPYRGMPEPPVKEPLTEFQRYVAASLGQVLPIYGASLFERVPATFAPFDRSPVSPDYVIGPGDELQLTVWGQVNFSRRLVVDQSGQVFLPDVGQLSVAGLKYADATPLFRAGIARSYKNFDLTVTMGRLRSIQVFVVGEARRPGAYTISSLSGLVNALFASGGPSVRGSMRDIQLKRCNKTVRTFDLYDLLVRGDKAQDTHLEQGDVILIPAAGQRAAIAGSVERPGIYELKQDTTLGDLLQLAGGLSPMAAAQQALLERVADGTAFEVQRIAMGKDGLATRLRNGDMIRLLPVIPRFSNTVTLRGNVADAGRFPWHSGMRLSDLIPSSDALLTRDYWAERNRLTMDGDKADVEKNNLKQPQDVPGEESETETASMRNGVAANLTPVSASRAINGIPSAFRDEARKTQGDSSLGAATGSDDVPPLRKFLPRDIVQPSAPEIDWDYAVIERLEKQNLNTKLIPFNLGKVVLEHNASQDLLLEAGDVITIFSKADFSVARAQQTKQVRIEGEVAMAGVYTAGPGDTLRSLVTRAGGLTPNAYLYGAQFTRESTRREQQKRYDDFLNQMERDVNQGAANLSGRVISTEQAATAQASVASQRELIDRLRQVPINGRIVLDLDPGSKGVNALPDLPLENGDRLYVPSRPSTVNVVGTVFEQAAFLYDDDLRVGDYLKKAGGPARSADRSHMFVIRADGAVVAKTATVGLFARNFETLPMYPGDTLVVPTHINRTTFIRGLMDWSQIFGNLALGSAAVNVLR